MRTTARALLAIGLSLSVIPLVSGVCAAQTTPGDAHTVDITATDYAFRAPDAIPSGWTTFRLTNEGNEAHFVFISRLPEGTDIRDYETQLQPAFARSWEAVRDHGASPEEAMQSLFSELPDWFPELQMIGGPGLVGPGLTSLTTLQLAPGDYAIECYLKTQDGRIHYMEGMVRPITVTAERSPARPPTPDVTVTLSNHKMDFDGEFTAGRRTIAVHIAENPDEGFGHSAHLARLNGAPAHDVVDWMNWFGRHAMAAPAPAEFVGGVHFMPVGETAYFTVDLVPGRYLLVSENTAHLGVHKEFTIR